MSIINDAIRKARKELKIRNDSSIMGIAKEEKAPVASKLSNIRWTPIIVTSLMITASLLGSVALYKHMSRLNAINSSLVLNAKSEIPVMPEEIPRKNTSSKEEATPLISIKDIMELKGIVYGPEGKWAIINNEVLGEGDSLLDGRVSFIAKDSVKIKRDDGEEIVLNLR